MKEFRGASKGTGALGGAPRRPRSLRHPWWYFTIYHSIKYNSILYYITLYYII